MDEKDAVAKYDPSKPSMIPVRLISTEKAENVLGFRAHTDLREGIRKTMEWHKKNLRSSSFKPRGI
jgi:nucleoside-diphosphate-sugar epimerase